jgi:hypothetical protein
MNRTKAGLVVLLVVVVGVFQWMLHRAERNRLRAEIQTLRAQLVGVEQLETSNRSLSNRLAEVQLSQQAGHMEKSELMRLRGEVGVLRQQQQAAQVQQTNPAAKPEVRSGEPWVGSGRIPRDQWVYAGSATAEAALQSAVWAMSQGDWQTLLALSTPETQGMLAKEFASKSGEEIAQMLRDEAAELPELVLDYKTVSPEGVAAFTVAVSESDDGTTRTRGEAVLSFREIDGEWRYSVGGDRERQ